MRPQRRRRFIASLALALATVLDRDALLCEYDRLVAANPLSALYLVLFTWELDECLLSAASIIKASHGCNAQVRCAS